MIDALTTGAGEALQKKGLTYNKVNEWQDHDKKAEKDEKVNEMFELLKSLRSRKSWEMVQQDWTHLNRMNV